MLTESKPVSNTKRMLFVVMLLALSCAVIAVAFAKQISQRFAGSADIPVRDGREGRKTERADARMSDKLKFLEPLPQTSAQFDLSRNVIAGGGGSSSAGNFKVEGTVGQAAAGTTSSGGQFTATGGFWQLESGVPPTPTPTPTATPTPTPTPTPSPCAGCSLQFSASNYNVN